MFFLDLKKQQQKTECIYGVFATVSVLRGTRRVPRCIKKQNFQERQLLISFFQLPKKVKVSG